jgi:hypothetical protein
MSSSTGRGRPVSRPSAASGGSAFLLQQERNRHIRLESIQA